VNGTLGKVIKFDKYNRLPVVATRDGREIVTEPMDWTVEDEGRVKARISQVPLRLAWAITVHKSQGMSLDASFMDLRSAFVAGQGYVAFSRVRTLSGLFLAGYNGRAMEVDVKVLEQDEVFREQSEEVEKVFTKMPMKEFKKMQTNFVRAR
jgi:ATP-dependent DNA helicase PIF1